TMDISVIVFVGALALAVPVGLTFYPIWYFIHEPLCRKLDPILFKEPYFRKSELQRYQHYPLCIIKSANYMYLIAIPSLAKKRRFRNFQGQFTVSAAIRFASIIYVLMALLGTIVFITIM